MQVLLAVGRAGQRAAGFRTLGAAALGLSGTGPAAVARWASVALQHRGSSWIPRVEPVSPASAAGS